LKRLPGDIEAIASISLPEDKNKLERLTHNLSGTLTAMKLKNGHAQAGVIERACQDKENDSAIREMASGLSAYLSELLKATRKYLK
ncbi:MAG: hypothetical protein ACKO7B_01400, partial [Flavobacteriales bacterium]